MPAQAHPDKERFPLTYIHPHLLICDAEPLPGNRLCFRRGDPRQEQGNSGRKNAAIPPELIVATEVVEEPQVTWRVMSSDEPSLKLPVAVKDWFDPPTMEVVEGATVIEVSVALLTVKVA